MRCIWLLCLSVSLYAQTVNISNLGTGTVSLAGEWKFHPGDDPRWADPNFDDSGWRLVKVPLSLDKQGYPNFSGYGWYRLDLERNQMVAGKDLKLVIGRVDDVYEVFANGTSIGRFGSFPPGNGVYQGRLMAFLLPRAQWSRNGRLSLAIRLWSDPRFARWGMGGITGGPVEIGLITSIDNLVAAHRYQEMLGRLPGGLVKCAELLLALALIAIYFLDRRPEYLWLGMMFAGDVFWLVLRWLTDDTFLLTFSQFEIINTLLFIYLYSCTIFGIWSLLDARVGRVVKAFLILVALGNFYGGWSVVAGYSGPGSWAFMTGLVEPSAVSLVVCFLLYRSRTVFGQTRWLALSFLPFFLCLLIRDLALLVPGSERFVRFDIFFLVQQTAFLVTVVAFGYLLLRRFGHARAEQQRLCVEMETARQVQRLMLPSQSVTVTDLLIDAVYLPAQEVGGDFFQVSQTKNGSLLMMIGDVSGKGLQSALTVSLLVGLWQDAIDTPEQSPRDVLSRLNKHLLQRVHGGFVTCLCLRLDTDGSLVIANAGHLAPYVDGQELAIASGLPLGIASEIEYSETRHVLASAESLVLTTDGVVEARDKTQSLYGFERLQQALSEHLGADALARRAQQFGQEDDITVISISRQVAATEPITQTQAASIAL